MCAWQCFQTVDYEQKQNHNSLDATEEMTEEDREVQDRMGEKGDRTDHHVPRCFAMPKGVKIN